ncbi:MAG: tripartite tricarboxylate transporter substrate binding protein [Clostridia bacterium]|nr:tripartite tricarboxylate transporter substrate binding protein [Clostridia bacterium]
MKTKLCILVLAVLLVVSSVAFAAGLPKKIEVQLPASAGGGTDVAGRQLAEYINKNSDQTLTIKNNTDGGGVVAYETIRTAKKDGSKILFFHSTMLIKYATGIYTHSPADEFKVAAVGLPTEKGGYVLVVPVESGVKTVDEFIALANEKNGELRIGVETGGSSHIMCGIMSKQLGITLRYVESGPDTEKLTNLVGGSIDCALVNANQAKQYIEGEKVNAVACFSSTDEGGRNSVLPDVPSFKELGYDCIFGTYFYVLLPTSASDETAKEIHDLYEAAANDPETRDILVKSGFGMDIAPFEDGAALIKGQQESLVSVCDELGLKK